MDPDAEGGPKLNPKIVKEPSPDCGISINGENAGAEHEDIDACGHAEMAVITGASYWNAIAVPTALPRRTDVRVP